MALAPLVLTDEQELLQQTTREFVAERAPVSHLRALRDTGDPDGFSRALWREMAELGWAGIIHPERFGGIELGYADLGVVLEECGRKLVPEPFLSTVVLGGEIVRRGASADRQEEILSGVCSGQTLLALALQEQGRFDPWAVATKAAPAGSGFRLTGRKCFVLDGHVADALIVVARTAGGAGERAGLSLFLVPPDSRGLAIERTRMVDSRNAARVSLDGVEVDGSALLGERDGAAEILDPVLDRAAIALSAELLGVIGEAFDRTIAYLKEREQFDVKIGSFQALKHRAAQMFGEVELSRSVVLYALRAIDEERPDLPRLASLAKARLSETAGLVTREAVQMHGGIGMTDEHEIGFFLKRARAAELTLGDATYHRSRFARLSGY